MFTNRTFGVEIEFVGNKFDVANSLQELGIACEVETYNHVTKRHWKIVTDASVRDGWELVSPILSGKDGLEELKIVCEGLQNAGARINRTCGLHVHHGARDFTTDTFKNLIKIYQRFESVIDTLVSESRRGSNNCYCKSVNNDLYRNALKRTGTPGALVSYVCDRYHKLNLQSYVTHGTVEFRQHQGTVEFEKISNWVKLTQAMVERALARPVKDGKTNTWERFKKFLFIERDGDKYRTVRDSETKEMFKYFNKRREVLAA